MEKMPDRFRTKEPRSVVWVLWAAMLMSLFIYAFVGYAIRQGPEQQAQAELLSVLAPVFAVISLINTIAALFVLRKVMANRSNYLSFCVVRWAFAESIGIFGLVLLMLRAPLATGLGFLGWSLALMLLLAPTRNSERKFINPSEHDLGPTMGGYPH